MTGLTKLPPKLTVIIFGAGLILFLALPWFKEGEIKPAFSSPRKGALSRTVKEIKRVQFLMGTQAEILVQGKNPQVLESALEKAFNEIARLEGKLSRFKPDSLISRINQNAGISPVLVDDEVFMLLEKSLQICQESQGAFDITVLPLLKLWRFDEENPSPPSEEEVKEKLKLVDCNKLILDQNHKTVFLPKPGMGIDLGGLAKGYAVDCAVRILKDNGVSAGIVNMGGDLRVFGGKDKGFALGIRHPRARGKVIAKIYLKEGAVATSGDYERYYFYQGIRYSHLLNPKTGYPAHREASVSVKAEECLWADAWATALFVLGSDDGLELLRSQPGLEVLFVEPSLEFQATRWFQENLSWINEY